MDNKLNLINFCKDKEMDWRGKELVIWIPFYYLQEFSEIVGYNYLSEGGIEANFQRDCIAIDLVPICEYHDIVPTDILERKD